MIECKDVTKIYGKGHTKVLALKSINLVVNKAEFVGIKGPSGSGKTTLLNIIASVDMPSAGLVFINGFSISDYDDKEISSYRRKSVGVVFQFFNLIPNLSVLENIELPMALDGMDSKQRKEIARNLLRTTKMGHLSKRYPEELSGGEKQRVAIMVALANSPSIVVADEPTGELDRENADVIMEMLQTLNRDLGTTILLATHDEYILNQIDRVITLIDGEIVKDERNSQSSLNDGGK